MTRIDLQTEHIKVPYREVSPAKLEIVISAPGSIKITTVESEDLLTGTVEYNIKEWKPEIWRKEDTVRINQTPGVEKIAALFFDARNKWNLQLGTKQPVLLDIKIGVCQGEWNLGSLPLTGLHLQTGAGKNLITFDKPNKELL